MQVKVDTLKKELEIKVDEILSTRREANLKLMQQESELNSRNDDIIDTITADHLHETQSVLSEYNKTHELLKDKISALQFMLEEADERFRKREAREEDVATIEELQALAYNREDECRKLLEEKRFLQLELMNRETNFNKVFSAHPSVGFMNPLDVSTGKRKKLTTKTAWSQSSMANAQSAVRTSSPGRLEPIPQAIVPPEKPLNFNKPLPATTSR